MLFVSCPHSIYPWGYLIYVLYHLQYVHIFGVYIYCIDDNFIISSLVYEYLSTILVNSLIGSHFWLEEL
jgi:hypothetical protein